MRGGSAGLFAGSVLVLVAGSVALGLQIARTAPPFELPRLPGAPTEPAALREAARQGGCSTGVPLWLSILDGDPEDLEALQAVAACVRTGEQLGLADDAARVLSVAASRGGRVADPAAALDVLRSTLAFAPEDPEWRVNYAYTLIDGGRVDEARKALRAALEEDPPPPGIAALYQVCFAWPVPTGAIAIGLLGLAGAITAARPPDFLRALRDAYPDFNVSLLVATLPVLAFSLWTRFALTGDRRAFATTLLLVAAGVAWTAASPLREPLGRGLARIGGLVVAVLTGRLRRVRPGVAMALLFAAVLVLVAVAPAVPPDLGLALMVGSVLVATSTLGVLLLAVVERAGSLRASLRWMAVAGTLPYLLYFLYVERGPLLAPLSAGRWLDPDTARRITGYLVVWVLGLFLALWLARILGRSILGPVERLEGAVRRIEQGDLEARTGVVRHDELGLLARAVDAMATGLAERRRIEATFRRYVDVKVADRLLRGDLERGRILRATVLFSDIRGFTSSSEDSDPEEVVALLNEYFGRMAPIVQRWGGVVDKFLGDGMLAVWGVPEPIPDAEARAVGAAKEMLAALEGFNAHLASKGIAAVRVGIGIHAGPVVAGPVGSPERREYTVIGDTVNTAQRVESQARGDHALLVTAAVRGAVDGEWVELPPVQVKGKAEPLALFGHRS